MLTRLEVRKKTLIRLNFYKLVKNENMLLLYNFLSLKKIFFFESVYFGHSFKKLEEDLISKKVKLKIGKNDFVKLVRRVSSCFCFSRILCRVEKIKLFSNLTFKY